MMASDYIREFLQACVAHAAINYTLLDVPGADQDTTPAVNQGGVLTSLQDAAGPLGGPDGGHGATANFGVDCGRARPMRRAEAGLYLCIWE